MKYSGLILNDFTAAPGVSVTFFSQGCPFRCKGCHNPESWDFEGGKEFTNETLETIIAGLTANGVKRNLAIMGGEPLCDENIFLTVLVINEVKRRLPDVQIYVWTGYVYEDLLKKESNIRIKTILDNVTCIIDGPYIEELRDTTLPMRGSSNQRIIYLPKGGEKID